MAVLLALLVLSWCVWAAWPARPGSRPPSQPQPRERGILLAPGTRMPAPVRPVPQEPATGRPHQTSAVAQRLTEDDLIAFGLALESSQDVLGELVGR